MEVHFYPAPTTLSWEISHKQILLYNIHVCVVCIHMCIYIYIKLYTYHSKMDVLWCDDGVVSVSF